MDRNKGRGGREACNRKELKMVRDIMELVRETYCDIDRYYVKAAIKRHFENKKWIADTLDLNEGNNWQFRIGLPATMENKPHAVNIMGMIGELKLAIALDRRGASEYVTYNVLSDEVHEYISQFGFVEEYGTFSDIEYFSDHTKIPSVNVSVGYYHQHTTHEQLNIDEMRLTLRRCIFIIAEPIEALYPVKEKVYKQGQQGYQYPLDYGWDYYDKRYDRKEDTYDLCEWCNYEAATTTVDWYGQKIYVCQYCAEIIIEELEDEKQKRRIYA